MHDSTICLIVHNIRSTHNVGSILRSCDGFGVKSVFLTGYTPYPKAADDERLPHIANKLDDQINKTALGAQGSVTWKFEQNPLDVIQQLKDEGYEIVALEQAHDSIPIQKYVPPQKVALLLGEEVEGISKELLQVCDKTVEIPMFGKKESFNVSVAAAVAIYRFRFL